MNIIIKPSNIKEKKYMAVVDDSKSIHFGQAGASDYTIHKDKERKQKYIKIHRANEDWSNPLTPGFYSRWVTWEKPTLKETVSNMNHKFKNINAKMR